MLSSCETASEALPLAIASSHCVGVRVGVRVRVRIRVRVRVRIRVRVRVRVRASLNLAQQDEHLTQTLT